MGKINWAKVAVVAWDVMFWVLVLAWFLSVINQ